MNLEIYSDRAKQAVQAAQSLALSRRNQQFGPEHLLKALLDERESLARDLIKAAGGRADQAATEVDALLAKVPQVEGGSGHSRFECCHALCSSQTVSARSRA